MNTPADNSVPSVLLGDANDTLLHIKNRGDNSDTGRWLTELVSDALEIAAHGDAEQAVVDEDVEVMVRWVAHMFNEFELYRIEFNQKMAGNDLLVAVSPLNLEGLSGTNDRFEAHVSAKHWALAFDASTRKLDVYMIPASLLLSFTTNRISETDYRPFVSFTPRRHADEYFWSVDNQLKVTFDMLPKLAKKLFGDLIKLASGNISEDEFFNKAHDDEVKAAQMIQTDRSYEPNFAGGAKVQSPISDQFIQQCETFSTAIDKEMQTIIDFAKTQPEQVDVLLKCKELITELDSLRVSATQVSEKLKQLHQGTKSGVKV